MKNPLVILSGPTAAGKTKLSLALAKKIGGEIISADSMQVYRYMDIGTAKIKFEETEGVRHHLIDCLNPDEEFNVSVFCELAEKAASEIYQRNHIPIVVGGTGFYIQAFLKGVSFDEEDHSDGFREQLALTAERPDGAALLYRELQEKDPDSALARPQGNVKRVIRALEFLHYHGYPISKHNQAEQEKPARYRFAYFVLEKNRDELYDGINQRVDRMMEEGLLKEVEELRKKGYDRASVAMQGLGYKQLLPYFDGLCTIEEATERIKQETRHFAKRQLTWFRREKDCIHFNKSILSEEEILQQMLRILEEKDICHGVFNGSVPEIRNT